MKRSAMLALVTLLPVVLAVHPAEARKKRVQPQAEPCFFICEQPPVVATRSNRRTSVAGIVSPLAAKVAQIQAACGSSVVSGVRHTRIAGTRRMSLHAQGKAVDMVGNPSCMYSQLRGWSGGYSTDYGRMRHIHISYDVEGGREMGLRFAHGGHRKYQRRAARHRHHREAAAH